MDTYRTNANNTGAERMFVIKQGKAGHKGPCLKNFQVECNLPTAPQCQFSTSIFQVSKAIVQLVSSSFTGMAIYGASQLMKFGCVPEARMAFIAETFIREGGRKVLKNGTGALSPS